MTFIRAPQIPADLKTEVFLIDATKEWFFTYEEYLQRMDYYRRRKFVCEITGNSCLTFFEALESETKEIQEVEKNFPEALREHILRFLQFNRITRLDQLVDKVYVVFKNDYFPGETIILKGTILSGSSESGARQRGTIKEKIQYSNPSDGLLTKYLVVRANDLRQAIVTNDKISRDRNHFTKWLIKAFIKLTMTRSHKVGAPWVVKNKFARKYRIGQEYPDDLNHFQSSTPSGDIIYEGDDILSANETTAGADRKAIKKTGSSTKSMKKKAALNNILDQPPPEMTHEEDLKRRLPMHHVPEHDSDLDEDAYKSSPQPSNHAPKKKTVDDLRLKFNLQHSKPLPETLSLPENAKYWNNHLIEELKSDNHAEGIEAVNVDQEINRLGMPNLTATQQALESWVFLNVYHSVLKLDTFTFDDFMYAMGWNHDQFNNIGRCKILDEIWCAVLGAIVSNEVPKNKSSRTDDDDIPGLLINLPSIDSYINPGTKNDDNPEFEDGGSESDTEVKYLKSEDEGENELSNGSIDLNNGTPNHHIANSDTKIKNDDENDGDDEGAEDEDEDNEDNEDNENGSEGESDENEEDEDEDRQHNAYIVMNYRNIPWHERLRKRNFRDGNWQCMLLGVLSLVEEIPAFAPTIEKVYRALAPVDLPATASTVMNQFYDSMDIELRFQALNIIVSLLMNGTVVRRYIDECLDLSTTLRRNRLDNIRDYKVAFDLAQKLNVEVHEKLSANDEAESKKSKSKSKSKLKQKDSTQTPDHIKRRIPRINLQAFEMSEQEAKLADKDKEFKSLCEQRRNALIDIDKYKKSRREFEKRLTEIDCQRVKLLGKDRLYNRYWWFENNGLPTLHGSSTGVDDNEDEENVNNINNDDADDSDDNAVLDETYLMGKLWVQGPSNDDLKIHLKLSEDESTRYQEKLQTFEHEINEYFRKYQDIKSSDDLKDQQFKKLKYEDFPEGFRNVCSDYFGLKFSSNVVSRILVDSKEDGIIMDQYGGLLISSLANELTPFQRKILEESPDPLINGSCWRFYDKPNQINKLIEWLNPWGDRESQLRKELLLVNDSMIHSITARRKALFSDSKSEVELEMENNIKQVSEKLKILGDKEIVEPPNGEPSTHESENGDDAEGEEKEKDDSDEDIIGTKRSLRKKNISSKRRKIRSVSEAIEDGDADALIELHSSLLEKLQDKREEKDLSRVLEWVNSTAIEEFDKTLYEGGDRAKARNSKGKR